MLTWFLKLKDLKKPITLMQFNFILAIWLGLVLNFGFFEKINQLTPYKGMKSMLFLGATLIVIVAIYNLLLQLISWKWSAKFFASLLIIIGGLSAYFVNSLGVIITPDQIQNLLQTDVREAKDLWSIRLVIWTLIFVLFPLGVVAVLTIEQDPLQKHIFKKAIMSSVSFIVIATLLFCFYVDYAAIFREHRDLKGMISPQNTIASTLSYYKKKSPKEKLPLIAYGEDAHVVQPAQPSKLSCSTNIG